MNQSSIEEHVSQLIAAVATRRPKPLLKTSVPAATESMAYDVLRHYVKQQQTSSTISGYKGALTNASAQKMFSTTSSAMGVLFSNGEITPDSTIAIDNYLVPLIETEIGFLVSKQIPAQNGPISTSHLLEHIGYVLPMIEIVDVGVDGRLAGAIDLIAINNAAANYIPGTPLREVNNDSIDKLGEITVSLSRNGDPLGEGSANDAMNGQKNALTWLVNEVLSQGYSINAGAYLMTGSLGRPYQAKPGKYHADYGDFGAINFEFIQDNDPLTRS